MGYSIEKVFKIYNDEDGSRIEVGPDSDGIGYLQIRIYDTDNKVETYIGVDYKQLPLLIKALQEHESDYNEA